MSHSRKCGCLYADERNPDVRSGHELGGYLMRPCLTHRRLPNTMESERHVAFSGPGNRATPIHAVDEPCDDSRESRVKR